jgi:hypothetical protein
MPAIARVTARRPAAPRTSKAAAESTNDPE